MIVFLAMGLWASLLVAGVSGVIGTYAVTKRIVNLCGSISHSVLAGMGSFLWMQRTWGLAWLEPIYGAFVAAVASAWIIGWIHLRYKEREDAVIAAIWSTGMAIGLIFISITPGTNVDLLNFLFGNILWITAADLWMLAGLNGAVALVVALLWRPLLAVAFDPDQARLRGLPVEKLYLLLLTLIAVSVVVLSQVIGVLLVMALLAVPPTIAGLYTRSLNRMMGGAAVLSGLFCAVGLLASFALNWPPGATIALIGALCYGLALLVRPLTLRGPIP